MANVYLFGIRQPIGKILSYKSQEFQSLTISAGDFPHRISFQIHNCN